MTRSSTVNMAAENSHDPPGVLQGPAQPRHYIPAFEVEPVRPHHNLKWWMVRKNRDGFGGLAAETAFVSPWAGLRQTSHRLLRYR